MNTIVLSLFMSVSSSTVASSTVTTALTSSTSATVSTGSRLEAAASSSTAEAARHHEPSGDLYLGEVEIALGGTYIFGLLDTDRGDATIAFIVHPFGRVEDDDSPRSWQAFLQHKSTAEVLLRGTLIHGAAEDSTLSQTIGSVAFAADLYLDAKLAIAASAEFGHLGESISNGMSAASIATSSVTGSHSGASIGFGFHPGDSTRVDVGFRYVGERTTISLASFPLNSPSAFVIRDVGGYGALRTVINRNLMLKVDADLFTQGGHGAVSAEYAFTKDILAGLGVSYLRVTRDSGVSIDSELAGDAFITWWPSGALRLRIEYAPMRSTNSEIDNVVYTQLVRISGAVRW